MAESLLGFVLTRLDQIESPVFLHRELERFPASDLAALVSEGLLRETSKATEIPRPGHLPAGGDLVVRQTSRGPFGVADEDDYFAPIPLTDDDVRQYQVSLSKLAARIRRENEIDGTGSEDHDGLISLGQKSIGATGTVDVYLSLNNEDEAVLLSRCRRLRRPAGSQSVILVTPGGASLSPEGQEVLDSARMVLVSMATAAAKGSLALDWTNIVSRPPEIAGAEAKGLDVRIRAVIQNIIDEVGQGRDVPRNKDEVGRRLHLGDDRKGLEYRMNKWNLDWEPYELLLRPQKKNA